jgi:hypothetical protein
MEDHFPAFVRALPAPEFNICVFYKLFKEYFLGMVPGFELRASHLRQTFYS